ncbi:relaxase/mobilization nuclease domain-containing protein [Erythrobacter donghaensis]|uniref:relaxase/mobilization nuclease domain-containing protein n=1 Tax=Erythrobacter donghaensis TaxID=267135 RepID=UPI0011814B87|nr:relaxase/mobilization nuclease domain-containing protein [Erythrobacter donghaensis]
MILKGSQRAGGAQLAGHLLNERDNDHVTLGEIRGFAADDLHGAFKEAQAVASGTRCKQYLFSLSLNPPIGADVSERDFERVADAAEKALGLEGQPRAIVFHEKEGRRHAHVVWSRIDPNEMRAINLAHFKNKLTALSRELYLEHGWQLPNGLKPDGLRNPLNFSLDEWQCAKREGVDPREIKAAFRDAWNRSDNRQAFANALAEYGYFLAQGDRRGFVAVDLGGNIHAVARAAGVKAKDVAVKLGDPAALPPVGKLAEELAMRQSDQLKRFIGEVKARHAQQLAPLEASRAQMRGVHKTERARLKAKQEERWQAETEERAKRVRTGFAGLVDRLTGKARAIKEQNRLEAYEGLRRDQRQRDRLISDQMVERRALQSQFTELRQRQKQDRRVLARDVMSALRQSERLKAARERDNNPRPDPAHPRRKRGISLDR